LAIKTAPRHGTGVTDRISHLAADQWEDEEVRAEANLHT